MKQEKAQHTPGPWKVRMGDLVFSEQKGRFIADCERTPYEKRPAPPDPEDHANARLIAAAPLLLEALKDAETKLSEYRSTGHMSGWDATLKAARAAIAAAQP